MRLIKINTVTRIICIVVSLLMVTNDVVFALGTAPGSLIPGTRAAMCALGERLFAAKRGPGSIDFDTYSAGRFIGDELLIHPDFGPYIDNYKTEFVKTDYTNPPDAWKNNPLLQETDLISAFKAFRDKETRIPSEKLEIQVGRFPVDEEKGELPIARIESIGKDRYVLVIHEKFVKMWNHIRENDVWFELDLNGQRRTASVAWGIFYRVAKHAMADLEKSTGTPKGLGHITSYPAMPNWDESLANDIGGNYAMLNDSVWLWFLGSYCFANSTRYNNNTFLDRVEWFFNGKEAQDMGLHTEFPALIKDSFKRANAKAFAYAINYHFFSRPGIKFPKDELSFVGPELIDDYGQLKATAGKTEIVTESLSATGTSLSLESAASSDLAGVFSRDTYAPERELTIRGVETSREAVTYRASASGYVSLPTVEFSDEQCKVTVDQTPEKYTIKIQPTSSVSQEPNASYTMVRKNGDIVITLPELKEPKRFTQARNPKNHSYQFFKMRTIVKRVKEKLADSELAVRLYDDLMEDAGRLFSSDTNEFFELSQMVSYLNDPLAAPRSKGVYHLPLIEDLPEKDRRFTHRYIWVKLQGTERQSNQGLLRYLFPTDLASAVETIAMDQRCRNRYLGETHYGVFETQYHHMETSLCVDAYNESSATLAFRNRRENIECRVMIEKYEDSGKYKISTTWLSFNIPTTDGGGHIVDAHMLHTNGFLDATVDTANDIPGVVLSWMKGIRECLLVPSRIDKFRNLIGMKTPARASAAGTVNIEEDIAKILADSLTEKDIERSIGIYSRQGLLMEFDNTASYALISRGRSPMKDYVASSDDPTEAKNCLEAAARVADILMDKGFIPKESEFINFMRVLDGMGGIDTLNRALEIKKQMSLNGSSTEVINSPVTQVTWSAAPSTNTKIIHTFTANGISTVSDVVMCTEEKLLKLEPKNKDVDSYTTAGHHVHYYRDHRALGPKMVEDIKAALAGLGVSLAREEVNGSVVRKMELHAGELYPVLLKGTVNRPIELTGVEVAQLIASGDIWFDEGVRSEGSFVISRRAAKALEESAIREVTDYDEAKRILKNFKNEDVESIIGALRFFFEDRLIVVSDFEGNIIDPDSCSDRELGIVEKAPDNKWVKLNQYTYFNRHPTAVWRAGALLPGTNIRTERDHLVDTYHYDTVEIKTDEEGFPTRWLTAAVAGALGQTVHYDIHGEKYYRADWHRLFNL